MKQTTLLLWLALISGLSVWGQTYESVFGEDSTVIYINYNEPGGYDELDSYFGITGDTVHLKGRIYQKMYYDRGSVFTPLRESDDHSQLWVYDKFDIGNEEKLVMDLSLSVGDTFWYAPPYNSPVLITGTREEEGRKVVTTNIPVHFDTTTFYVEFIEGIGPNIGFSDYTGVATAILQCLFKDGELMYTHPIKPDSLACDQNGFNRTDIEETPPAAAIMVTQPNDGQLNIQGSNLSNAEIEVLDLTGRRVYNRPAQTIPTGGESGSEIHIPLHSLSPGLYILNVKDAEGGVTSWKFRR